MKAWHFITGEYPPQLGGVADHTRNLARGLAAAGEEVHVWAPSNGAARPSDDSVTVHVLPDHFGPRALQVLSRSLNGIGGRIFVQYVPHAFGWKAMNLPFCLWLLSRRRQPVAVMFHEVAFPMSRKQPFRHNVLGAVNRLMAMLVARAADRIYVPTPGWGEALRPLIPANRRVEWLPVCSNVPPIDDPGAVKMIRARYSGASLVGHFGAYDPFTAEMFAAVAPAILSDRDDAALLLLGEHSVDFRDKLLRKNAQLARRVHATGALAADDLSRHLRACDVMVQPYADGVSTRRTSLMACLDHGIPVVTTSGVLTEPLWAESGAVIVVPWGDVAAARRATLRLLDEEGERARLARIGRELYARRFDLRHAVQALLNSPGRSDSAKAVSPVPCELQ